MIKPFSISEVCFCSCVTRCRSFRCLLLVIFSIIALGLGLYIVRSITTAWGGTAWGEPRAEGNAFAFTVPSVSWSDRQRAPVEVAQEVG